MPLKSLHVLTSNMYVIIIILDGVRGDYTNFSIAPEYEKQELIMIM